jgi:hypothetical protein
MSNEQMIVGLIGLGLLAGVLLFVKLGGLKLVAMITVVCVIVVIVTTTTARNVQQTVQAPADAINSTLASTSLAESNAAAITSLSASNVAAQSALSTVTCVMPIIVLVIVVALTYLGVLWSRWYMQKQSAQVPTVARISTDHTPMFATRKQPSVAQMTTRRVSRRQVRKSGAMKMAGRWWK